MIVNNTGGGALMTTEKNKAKVNTCKVKARILELGLTQDGVAKDMNLDYSTLNLKINNKRRIYMDEVYNLCEILDIKTPTDLKEYFGLDFLNLISSRENATIESGGGA